MPKGEAYTCKCSDGYQGQYCDRRQEPPACRGQRCGHGECRVSESGEPVCHCQPGYSGPTCDKGESDRSHSLSKIYNIKTMSDSFFLSVFCFVLFLIWGIILNIGEHKEKMLTHLGFFRFIIQLSAVIKTSQSTDIQL